MNDKQPKSASDHSMTDVSKSAFATRLRNFTIVMVAVLLSAAIFLGLQTGSSTASLSAMAETATPLEEALSNGKPTLMEFYADWCTSCQSMAQDMTDLKTEYSDRVNFVMLNVDNTKWLPEMLHYRVDGIPHFVFLDRTGETLASTIGEQPRSIMAANLDALMAGGSLPYAQAKGRVSGLEAANSSSRPDDPRSHGSQVVQ
jgi:thiol-disulfide isomerase/thioredoxin